MLFSLQAVPLLLLSSLASWNPARVHHVDTIGDAHLFRGPAPVEGGTTFVLDELKTTIQAVARNEGGVTVPDTFELVVISMLDSIKGSEKTELQAEQTFFAAQHPSLLNGSRLIHWPIVGAITSPSIYPKSICLDKAKKLASSDSDKMVDKTKQIHDMLAAGVSDGTLVVYFHCDAGMDRTGEMYGDYCMRYLNQTYGQVYAFDNTIEGNNSRKINTVNKQALEWMCLYLLEVEGIDPACNMCV